MTLSITIALLALWSLWTMTLFTVWLCGNRYFPLTTTADDIVLAGVLAFSLGGLGAVAVPLWKAGALATVSAQRRLQIDRWLTFAVVLFLLNIPVAYRYFKQLSSTIAPRESMWKQIRIASSKANVTAAGAHLSLEALLLPFLTITAMIAVYEYVDNGRRGIRALVLFVLAMLYQLINGARSEVLLLLISSLVILWIKRGAAPLRLLLFMALLFLLVFSLGQIAMNKYGALADAPLGDNLPRVAEGFGTYWLGGIIAFDQNRQNPELRYGWDLGKFVKRIANRFGATYPERDRNLDYTRISPTQMTNVYTAFLPYYMDHGGFAGVAGLMFLMGFLSTYVYRCALHGRCWAVFTLGAFVYATAMTIFSEEYFAQITFWIKAGALSTLVYFAPGIAVRTRSHWAERDAPEPCE
jgi:oligosaccharide repeat unit polymerase